METWPYTTHHPLVSFGRDFTIEYGYLLADTYKKRKKKKKKKGRVGPLL